jgi:Tfp pilus assembly protein PilF
MDGRGALKWNLCLLIAAAGCQHQVMTLPGSAPASSSVDKPDPTQIKKASSKPKDLPPSVLVSYGNFEAGEAFAAGTAPDRQQQLCDSAREDYQKALKSDPKCLPAYQGLARLYTHMHDLPLAVETYRKALKLAPNDASLWFELGLCHNYQKNLAPALECLERATQIDPGNRSYTNALGVILAESGRYNESLKCFARSGGEAMGYYRLAKTLDRLQKPELSRRYLEVAVQKDPNLAPSIQQASYQPAADAEPSAPPAQEVSPEPSAPAPQIVSPEPSVLPAQPASPEPCTTSSPTADPEPSAPQAKTASPEPSAPAPQLLLPPVPQINEGEEEPKP